MKSSFLYLFSTLCVAGVAPALQAASLTIHTNELSNGDHAGSFSIQPISGPANNADYHPWAKLDPMSFESFCLEPREDFDSGETYNYTVSGAAMAGDNEMPGRNWTPGDQLSLGTTWLYSQFAMGTLTNFNYEWSTPAQKAARKDSNLQLQRAFWYLEDDYSLYNSASALMNPFLSLVAWKFGSLDAAQHDAASGAYGVWALNLTSDAVDKAGVSYQKLHQSQLWYHGVPDTATTLGLFGASALALFALRRRLVQA